MTTSIEQERDRIRTEYARRKVEIGDAFYARHRPANLFLRQGQERALRDALGRAGFLPLDGKRVLEIGVGDGQWLELFAEFGADEANLAGIDLLPDRIARSRARFPRADLRDGDASALPWPDGAFDVVFQSTVFTSILDREVRARVADEMCRVLAPGGVIVWYDFAWNNPRNKNVRGVSRREIRSLFAGARIEIAPVTLAPPLARVVAPRSWTLAALLEGSRLLNTHLMATIRPRARG